MPEKETAPLPSVQDLDTLTDFEKEYIDFIRRVEKHIPNSGGLVSEILTNYNDTPSNPRCTRKQLTKLIHHSPALQQAMIDAEQECLDLAEGELFKLIKNGKLEAIKFYLNAKGRSRGYYKQGGKIDGAGTSIEVQGGGAINVAFVGPADTDAGMLARGEGGLIHLPPVGPAPIKNGRPKREASGGEVEVQFEEEKW